MNENYLEKHRNTGIGFFKSIAEYFNIYKENDLLFYWERLDVYTGGFWKFDNLIFEAIINDLMTKIHRNYKSE